jgi:hypothetical protein
MGFVVDKVALGQVSSANLHSTKFSITTVTRASDLPSGPSSTPHYANKKIL